MSIDPTLEFHRHAVARMPSPEDRHPGVAFFVSGKPSQQFCTCRTSGKGTCAHLKTLMRCLAVKGSPLKSIDLEARFNRSLWYALAEVLNQGDRLTMDTARIQFLKNDTRTTLEIKTADGASAITYASTDADRNRLAERFGALCVGGRRWHPRPRGGAAAPAVVDHDRCGAPAPRSQHAVTPPGA